MSYSAIDMNKVSEALNRIILAPRPSTSSMTTPTLSRVPSLTYPPTRVQGRTTIPPPPPPSPSLILVREEAANTAHGTVENTFQLNYLSVNPAPGVSSWTNIPRRHLPAGVDSDEDEYEDEENSDLDFFPLADRTVDSVEIIRRNTGEKKLSVESCTSRSSKTVLKEAMRSVEMMVRDSVMGLARRFSS